VTRSRQRRTGFDRCSARESTTFDAERDLHLTDYELVTEKKSMPKFVSRPDLHLTKATVSIFQLGLYWSTLWAEMVYNVENDSGDGCPCC